ncbi:MAG TPA: O-antigen ligase family protein [Desulfomonilia bacterium]
MIDKLFFVVLVLNATGLFSFLAEEFDVSIAIVTGTLLGLNIFYLIIKLRYSIAVFRMAGIGMLNWFVILLVWPLFTLLYAQSLEIREIGLQVYYFTLFSGAAIYTIANGLTSMRRLLAVSLVITIFGMVLNLLAPQYFEAVSYIAGAEVLKEGRVCGFILQPNQLALSLDFMFIAWFMLWGRRRIWLEAAAILIFMLLILLTGSRTGMVSTAIIVIFILMPERNVVSRRYLLKLGTLMLALVAGIAAMKFYLAQINYTDVHEDDLINRMELMLNFKLGNEDDIKNIGSIQQRIDTQAFYWSLFKESPLFGHGFGAEAYYKESGNIFLSAHSDALKSAMEYGFLYPAVFCLLVLLLYRRKSRREIERFLKVNSIGQFVSITVLLFCMGSIMDTRTFYIILGMFFAVVYCPRRVFCYDDTSHITRVLSRREITGYYKRKQRRIVTADSDFDDKNTCELGMEL